MTQRRLSQLPRRSLRALWRLATDLRYRAEWWTRLRAPTGGFQPYNHTGPNRYPLIFQLASKALAGREQLRVLSFGCSTGDEVFSLRSYFPGAEIKGVDVNPRNIAICRKRLAKMPDPRIAFAVADSTDGEPDASYDAIFCMAVLRHGGLAGAARCDHLIKFENFSRITTDFARCLKPGGLLVNRHSNFRFRDVPAFSGFAVLHRVPVPPGGNRTPVFGPDNCLMPGEVYTDAIFLKNKG